MRGRDRQRERERTPLEKLPEFLFHFALLFIVVVVVGEKKRRNLFTLISVMVWQKKNVELHIIFR